MKSFLDIILMPNLILGVAFVILHTDQTYCNAQEQKLHLLVPRSLNSHFGKKLAHTKPVRNYLEKLVFSDTFHMVFYQLMKFL